MDQAIGSVYILCNEIMPGWIKVGRTQHGLANQHAHRMTRRTRLSTPFEVVYEVKCQGAIKLERSLHDKLQLYRCPGKTYYTYPVDYEYPVENAIWELERLYFPYMSIEDATFLLETLHFDYQETSEWMPENNHPWNQKAKQLLLQLPDDDADEYDFRYNSVPDDCLYVLQLMEWGLNTRTVRKSSQLPLDDSQWTNSERMTAWRANQWHDGYEYALVYMPDIERQMYTFKSMNPKQIMLFLMVYPRNHPQEAINPVMDAFMDADDPVTRTICLFESE